MRLARDTTLFDGLRQAGQREVQQRFSVMTSVKALEVGFQLNTGQEGGMSVF